MEWKWNLEVEKSLAILLSIIDLGGADRKKNVLDNIYDRHYLDFNENDMKYRETLDEQIWRNDLAYIRLHLVKSGYIDGEVRDHWQITKQGKCFFCAHVHSHLKELNKSNPRKPLKITKKWYKRVKEIIRKECPLMKDNIDIVLTSEVIKYIDDL